MGSGESPFNQVPAVDKVVQEQEGDLATVPPNFAHGRKSHQWGGEAWVRTTACLYFEVDGPEPKIQEWRPGPLPVSLPDGRQADRIARAAYFNARAAESLYGPSDRSSPTRWFRTDAAWPEKAWSVHGIELLRFPRYSSALQDNGKGPDRDDQGTRYLAVIHLSLPANNLLNELAAAVRLDSLDSACVKLRQLYEELLGPGYKISSQVQRAFSVVMLTWKGQLSSPEGAPREWTPITSWLWCAASASRLQDFCPDTHDPHLLDGIVYLSASWRALVLRDGIAFLSLTEDTQASKEDFFAWGEAYVRSLYTDVALLAALEREALDDFVHRLARIGDRFEKSVEFRSLVNEVTEFRNVFWQEHVTRHGIANDILRQLHTAHRTLQVFARVITDLDAFRQQVEAQALEASLLLQKAEERRSRKFEHAASVVLIAFGLPVIVLAAMAVPIRGLTSDGHDIPGWVVITIALASVALGAAAGAAGSWWLARGKAREDKL